MTLRTQACSVETFKRMIAVKTPSWAQKKRCVAELVSAEARLEAVEQKMMRGEALAPEEQEYYDEINKEGIKEKITWLEGEIKSQVDGGQLTMGEKQQLLAQMETKVLALKAELDAARAEDKPKKAEKLEAQLGALNERKVKVQAIEPIRHPLKHEDAIKELRVAIEPLLKLEAQPGLRSMEEMKKIGTRPDMEAEVARLEIESRGYFEEEAEFSARCAFVAAAALQKAAKAAEKAAAKKAGAGAKSSDQWETVSSMGNSAAKGKSSGRR